MLVERDAAVRFAFDRQSMRTYGNRKAKTPMLVPDRILKTVVFLGTKPDGVFVPHATAFVVSVFEGTGQFLYLITADHVAAALMSKRDDVYARVNLISGGTEDARIDSTDWIYCDDRSPADVVALRFDPSQDVDLQAVGLVGPRSLVASDAVLNEAQVGLGDEIAIVGLFTGAHGRRRNIPIVRTGNLAAMPDEPLDMTGYGQQPGYLIEARSIAGLSGSPVFVNIGPYRILDGKVVPTNGPYLYLLGLMHGHFDVAALSPVTDRKSVRDGVNTGIGIVVPARTILDLLMTPTLINERRAKIPPGSTTEL